MVSTRPDSSLDALMRHDLRAIPFNITMQLPHDPIPQPHLVPVRRKSFLRISRSVRAATVSRVVFWPFTKKETFSFSNMETMIENAAIRVKPIPDHTIRQQKP
jgi:hypothetical protein